DRNAPIQRAPCMSLIRRRRAQQSVSRQRLAPLRPMSSSRARPSGAAQCRGGPKTEPPKKQPQRGPAGGRPILFVLKTLTRRLHSYGVKMRGSVNQRRQGPANALMNSTRHIILFGGGIEVESAVIVPILHDC